MTRSTPEDPQQDRRTAGAAGQGRTGDSGAPAGSGPSHPSGDSAASGSRSGTAAPASGAPAGGKSVAGSQKGTGKNATGKAGSDWSMFRSVVVLVGLIIAGFGGYYLITGTAGLPEADGGAVNPTLENQFRFFAAMMVGVGAAFVTIAIKFQWANMLWLVCLMVFIGGVGRVLSWAFSGTPHYLLIILMVLELAFPAALLVWHRYISKTSELKRRYASRT